MANLEQLAAAAAAAVAVVAVAAVPRQSAVLAGGRRHALPGVARPGGPARLSEVGASRPLQGTRASAVALEEEAQAAMAMAMAPEEEAMVWTSPPTKAQLKGKSFQRPRRAALYTAVVCLSVGANGKIPNGARLGT